MGFARWSALAVVATLTAACSAPTGVPAPPASTASGEPSAAQIAPDRRVGAVFLGGQTLHVCSGSVLDTSGMDVILTAAHCLADGVDTYFVPDFTGDTESDDVWRVDAVYLDPRWLKDQDPLADFAIARVSSGDGPTLRERVGGGFALGTTPPPGTDVTVHGYAFGVGSEQLGCRARTTMRGDFPELPCAGLVDGTSGSPWVSGSTVVGIVGGLQGGGCEENVSYSPPFGDAVRQVLDRARAGGAGDAAPTVYDDDC